MPILCDENDSRIAQETKGAQRVTFGVRNAFWRELCVNGLGWHLEISSGTWRCVREGIQTQRWKSVGSVGKKLSGAGAGDRRRGRVSYKRWWELY